MGRLEGIQTLFPPHLRHEPPIGSRSVHPRRVYITLMNFKQRQPSHRAELAASHPKSENTLDARLTLGAATSPPPIPAPAQARAASRPVPRPSRPRLALRLRLPATPCQLSTAPSAPSSREAPVSSRSPQSPSSQPVPAQRTRRRRHTHPAPPARRLDHLPARGPAPAPAPTLAWPPPRRPRLACQLSTAAKDAGRVPRTARFPRPDPSETKTSSAIHPSALPLLIFR